jgi:hypothetical protein
VPRVGAIIWPAMYRAPKPADLFHAPPEFLCQKEGAAVALPIGPRVRPGELRAFLRAMARLGLQVQAARLGYDRLYARQCFEQAHASGDAGASALAFELARAFEGGAGPAG